VLGNLLMMTETNKGIFMCLHIELITLNGIAVHLRVKPHPPHLTPLDFHVGHLASVVHGMITVRKALLHSRTILYKHLH
jgi:hypothetical protein